MNSINGISVALRRSAGQAGMRQSDLRIAAGVSQRTLTNVFSGTSDFKVSTLLALADRVGLDVVLVPKAAAVAVAAGATSPPLVKSRVAAALERVSKRGSE